MLRSFPGCSTAGEIFKCNSPGCPPQMFCNTIAAELLPAGVPIDQVSLLLGRTLGHTPVKSTERHEAPFAKARQPKLQESARNAWKVNEGSRQNEDSGPSGVSSTVQQTHRRSWQLISTDSHSIAEEENSQLNLQFPFDGPIKECRSCRSPCVAD
jgi:hypothetical protein